MQELTGSEQGLLLSWGTFRMKSLKAERGACCCKGAQRWWKAFGEGVDWYAGDLLVFSHKWSHLVHPRANCWISVCHPAHIQNENPNSVLVFFSSLCYNFKCSRMHGTWLQHPRRFETEFSTGNMHFCPGAPDLAIAMQAIVIKQKHISSYYHTPSTWSLPFKWVFNERF